MPQNKIAFQGAPGAYSDIACRSAFPDLETLPCETFAAAFESVTQGEARYAMIPIENTIAGRVADVHHLIPESGLQIVAEHFEPIHHNLVGLRGADIESIRHVHSHVHALPQCRDFVKKLGAQPHVAGDTAVAARMVAELNDPAHGAISSELAAELYGLEILARDIQDAARNTTRFVVFEKQPGPRAFSPNEDYITSFFYSVRSIPAALYKALGGFATNGVNLVKLESYVDENFNKAQFYMEVEGHCESPAFKLAYDELQFFATELIMLGSYPSHPFRKTAGKRVHKATCA